jgi:glycosyltransferase involved in cell wall biosynthesis
MRILLTTEHSYPHHRVDVSRWCQSLLKGIPEHQFLILAIRSPSRLPIVYERPKNVEKLINAPLFQARTGLKGLSPLDHRMFEQASRQMLGFLQQDLADFAQGISKLAKLGHQHQLWDAFESPQFWRSLQSLLQQHLPYIPSLAEVAQCAKWLRSSLTPILYIPAKTDLVHATNTGLAGLAAWIASSHHGIPLVITEHEIYLRQRHLDTRQPFALRVLQSQFFQSLAKLLYLQADRIISTSEFVKTWQRQLKAPAERIQTIHNGIDPDLYTPSPVDEPVVLWSGHIEPKQDLETLIQAFWHVRRTIPDAKLKLFAKVLDTPLYQRLLELRQNLGLSRAVCFHTLRPSQEILAEGKVMAFVSQGEMIPFNLLEAMASQKAIVATRVGGSGEALGKAGRLVDQKQPATLATALIELLMYPKVRETLGKRARHRILQGYNLDTTLDTYANLYTELTYTVHPSKSAVLLATDRPLEKPPIIVQDRAA